MPSLYVELIQIPRSTMPVHLSSTQISGIAPFTIKNKHTVKRRNIQPYKQRMYVSFEIV